MVMAALLQFPLGVGILAEDDEDKNLEFSAIKGTNIGLSNKT